jgi:hypothetical protein
MRQGYQRIYYQPLALPGFVWEPVMGINLLHVQGTCYIQGFWPLHYTWRLIVWILHMQYPVPRKNCLIRKDVVEQRIEEVQRLGGLIRQSISIKRG